LGERGERSRRGGAYSSIGISQCPSESSDGGGGWTHRIELRRCGTPLPSRIGAPLTPGTSQRGTLQPLRRKRPAKGERGITSPDVQPFGARRIECEMGRRRGSDAHILIPVAERIGNRPSAAGTVTREHTDR